MKDAQIRVTAVVIMHGNRWKFLSQMITAVLKDEHITKLVIVDNGSQNKQEIIEGTKQYGDRVTILRVDKNRGSAGGFALGIEAARKTDCDFVYLSDDDMVTGPNFVSDFLTIKHLFPEQKVVICGNRADMPGNKNIFYSRSLNQLQSKQTFFEVFGISRIINFFSIMIGTSNTSEGGVFVPVVPTKGFVYGGAFIPIDAVRRAPLPDASLFLYCDDVEYSWGIEALGYTTYVASSVAIHDLESTFGEDNHIVGLYREDLADFKVYYRIRNMVKVSRRHTTQSKLRLVSSVIIWVLGLLVVGLSRAGFSRHYVRRSKLIIEAVRAGYDEKRTVPSEIDAFKV
jgi:GT2 family glycosyltransferase